MKEHHTVRLTGTAPINSTVDRDEPENGNRGSASVTAKDGQDDKTPVDSPPPPLPPGDTLGDSIHHKTAIIRHTTGSAKWKTESDPKKSLLIVGFEMHLEFQ